MFVPPEVEYKNYYCSIHNKYIQSFLTTRVPNNIKHGKWTDLPKQQINNDNACWWCLKLKGK